LSVNEFPERPRTGSPFSRHRWHPASRPKCGSLPDVLYSRIPHFPDAWLTRRFNVRPCRHPSGDAARFAGSPRSCLGQHMPWVRLPFGLRRMHPVPVRRVVPAFPGMGYDSCMVHLLSLTFRPQIVRRNVPSLSGSRRAKNAATTAPTISGNSEHGSVASCIV